MLALTGVRKRKTEHQSPVRIGLLLCGEVHDALQPRFGSYAHCLVDRLRLNRPGVEVKVWQAWKGQLPGDVMGADAYLISGSPASVFDQQPWVLQLADFVRRAHSARRRLLGICFGHQMIHHALGGRVERTSGWGLGLHQVHLHRPTRGLPRARPVQLYAMHRDQVVTPAEDFEHLGASDHCPWYLTRRTDQVLTIQGHPEFTPEFFRQFLDVAKAKFGADAVARARRSISDTEDGDLTCQLLNRFLLNNHT